MNKLLAMFFVLGALACFGLSVGTSYQVQDQTRTGAPVGEPRTVYIKSRDRLFYVAFGGACMAAGLYFITQIRREDAH
jgi:hypothetical protein